MKFDERLTEKTMCGDNWFLPVRKAGSTQGWVGDYVDSRVGDSSWYCSRCVPFITVYRYHVHLRPLSTGDTSSISDTDVMRIDKAVKSLMANEITTDDLNLQPVI